MINLLLLEREKPTETNDWSMRRKCIVFCQNLWVFSCGIRLLFGPQMYRYRQTFHTTNQQIGKLGRELSSFRKRLNSIGHVWDCSRLPTSRPRQTALLLMKCKCSPDPPSYSSHVNYLSVLLQRVLSRWHRDPTTICSCPRMRLT